MTLQKEAPEKREENGECYVLAGGYPVDEAGGGCSINKRTPCWPEQDDC